MADDVVLKMGLRTGGFLQPLQEAGVRGAEIAGRMAKKFEMRDIGRTMATALGLNIEDMSKNVARFLSGFSEEYETALKRVDEASASAANAQIQSMKALLGAEQKYLLAIKDREATLKRIRDNAPHQTGDEAVSGLFEKAKTWAAEQAAKMGGLNIIGAWGRGVLDDKAAVAVLEKKVQLDKEAERVAADEALIREHELQVIARRVELEKISRGYGMETLTSEGRLAEINSEIAEVQDKISSGAAAKRQDEDLYVKLQDLEKERLGEINVINKATTLDASQRHELAVLEAKGVEQLSESEGVRYRVLHKISEELQNQGEIEHLLFGLGRPRTEQESERLRYLQQHSKELLLQQQIIEATVARAQQLFGLQSGQLVMVKDQAGVEHAISAEKLKQLSAQQSLDEAIGLQNLMLNDQLIIAGKIYGMSHNTNDISSASDAELKELVRRQKAEIDKVKADEGHGPTALADAATNFLVHGSVIDRLQTDINRAQAELDQRQKERDNLATLGSAGARQASSIDPLKYDQFMDQISRTQTATDQTNYLLHNLVQRIGPNGAGDLPATVDSLTTTVQRGFGTLSQQLLAATQRNAVTPGI